MERGECVNVAGHAKPDTNRHANGDSDKYADRYTNEYPHKYADRYTNGNTDEYPHEHADRYTNTDSHSSGPHGFLGKFEWEVWEWENGHCEMGRRQPC